MTARQMHLAMLYAGHNPTTAANAALDRGAAWSDYDFVSTFFAHSDAYYGAASDADRLRTSTRRAESR